MISTARCSVSACFTSIVLFGFLIFGGASSADAQFCMSYDPPDPFDTSSDCGSMPENDRTFQVGVQEWNASDFLIHSRGNDLEYLTLDDPQIPVFLNQSEFNVGNQGDSDYDLLSYSVCDNCRFGFSVHKMATVFFDLGVAATPSFADYEKRYDYPDLRGGMTFRHEGTQYLLLDGIRNDVCNSTSGLFLFDSKDPDALQLLECVYKPNQSNFKVAGGTYLQDNRYSNGDGYLWLSDGNQLHIYRILKSGGAGSLNLQYVKVLDYGNTFGTALGGVAVDYDRGLAVTTSYSEGLKVWQLTDFGNPQLTASRPNVEASWVAMGNAVIVAGAYGNSNALYSFDLTVSSNPVPLDQVYWDVSRPWNDLPCQGRNLGATFTRNGDFLFTSRWEMLQRHDFRNCGGPQAPIAHATLGRWNGNVCGTLVGDVFPGDGICATSESSGDITSTEIWITDSSGMTVDSASGGATVPPLPYAIPIGGSDGQPSSKYTAHVRVSNDDGETEDTTFTLVNLTPDATISYTPVAPLAGESLTLSVEAEGSPGLPDGSGLPDPFEWTITVPSGGSQVIYGENPPLVLLSEGGHYEIGLTVYYRHGVPTPYSTTDVLNLEVSSVSAAFDVTPTHPVNTADVVLNGGPSRWSDGVTPLWQWEFRQAAGAWQDLTPVCGASQMCTIHGSDASQFFVPGTYDFQLTLTNETDESIVQVTGVEIADGTVVLDFSWNPTVPEIGEDVGFHVEGTMSVESVTWSFGGTACTSTIPQNWTCNPQFLDCLSVPYAYASGGNKSVSMSAVIDGQDFGPINHTVTVANTGSCGGGGGGGGGGGTPSCSYVVFPTTRTVPATGGSGYAISVSTQVGCAWNVSENASWISVTSNSSGSGNATVTYNVSPNSGTTRSAVMTIGGQTHTVTQYELVPVDFTFTPTKPDIGEEAIFSVTDNRVTPIRWEFDGAHCDGSSAVLDCTAAPAACLSIPWEYEQAGWKAVRLVAQEGEKTRGIQVLDQGGECCSKDGPPTAAFTMTPNPVLAGGNVVFADASFKSDEIESPKTTALGFTWDPVNPAIGEPVVLTITGVSAVNSAEWDMGSTGCGAYEQVGTCTPLPGLIDCLGWTYEYASAGTKTVALTINGGQSLVTNTITVLDEGVCGGGGGCSYSISPSLTNFGQNGGNGTITVTTTAGCQWTATKSASWISITGGSSGSGSGTVIYSVAPNTGAYRTANIVAAGKNHSVRQAAYEGPQDTGATTWNWTVSRGGTTVVTSNQPTFTYSFDEPGLYDVRYEVSNCAGSDVALGQLLVEAAGVTIPKELLVASAVHAPGLHGTQWRTDIRIFNPDDGPVTVVVEFQPEDTNNVGTVQSGILFEIPPGGTRIIDDILQAIPGIIIGGDDSASGALAVAYTNDGDEEVPPLVISRTYNDTPDGTFGQFVPAVPVLPAEDHRLFLTGLVHNLYYRTNIRLANMGDTNVMAVMRVLDRHGEVLGDPIYPVVPAQSTTQVNAVSEAAGIVTNVEIFSIQVDTGSPWVWAGASVVDNQNGDPVFFSSMEATAADDRLWIPGIAHLAGLNDSEWRTDVTFFNPTSEDINFDVKYVPSEDLNLLPSLKVRGLHPGEALFYVDILGTSMLPAGVESKGYFVIERVGGTALPQVTARTYNVDLAGGTFGQNVFVFRATDLVDEGAQSFVPGIAVSATNSDGFRTNFGVFNTDASEWAQVRLTVREENGDVAGEVTEIWLEPGQFKQFNLSDRINLPAVDMDASVVIEVLSGGPVGAYGSTVDNQTQDPILIPAVPDITQLLK